MKCTVCVHPSELNFNDVEITVSVVSGPVSDLHILGIYRSKSKVNLRQFIDALNIVLDGIPNQSTPIVILGDFNVNLLEMSSESRVLTADI